MQSNFFSAHWLIVAHTSDELLEANVTIIDNQKCSKYLKGNVTNNQILRTKLKRALSDGVNSGLLCSTGNLDEKTKLYSVGKCIRLNDEV